MIRKLILTIVAITALAACSSPVRVAGPGVDGGSVNLLPGEIGPCEGGIVQCFKSGE